MPVGSETATPVRARPKSSASTFRRAPPGSAPWRSRAPPGASRGPCRPRAPSSGARRRRRRRAADAARITLDASRPRSSSVRSKLATRCTRPSSAEASTTAAGCSRCLHLVGELEQLVGRQLGDLADDHVDAACGLGLVADVLRARRRRGLLAARLLPHPLELGPQLVDLVGGAVEERVGLAGGDRLDPARAAPDRALGEDRERADLGRRAHVGAAAELGRVARGSRRRGRRRRTSRRRASSRRASAPPRSASRRRAPASSRKICSFTRFSTSSRSSALSAAGWREVEAELVRPHGRAGLLHVVAEHVAQRLLEQVRRGVVRHRREPHRPGHDRAHPVAGGEALALEEQRLVAVEAERLAQARLAPRSPRARSRPRR